MWERYYALWSFLEPWCDTLAADTERWHIGKDTFSLSASYLQIASQYKIEAHAKAGMIFEYHIKKYYLPLNIEHNLELVIQPE